MYHCLLWAGAFTGELLIVSLLLQLLVMLDRYGNSDSPYGLSYDEAILVFFNNLTSEGIDVSQTSSNCYKVSYIDRLQWA